MLAAGTGPGKIQDVLVTKILITDDIDPGDWKCKLAEAVVDPFVPVAHSNQSAYRYITPEMKSSSRDLSFS